MQVSKTVVISCAGMGTRLGMNLPKSLIDINGKTLIEWQLEMLKDVSDIRIVIGYKYQDIIDVVIKIRPDCVFVFNRDFFKTGTADSYVKGTRFSPFGNLVISLDGDLLVHPDDFKQFLNTPYPCIAIGPKSSEEPVFVNTLNKDGEEFAYAFSRIHGDYEWTGLAQLRAENVCGCTGHVYQLIEPLLPLPTYQIRAQEIDTYTDYLKAKEWIKNVCK